MKIRSLFSISKITALKVHIPKPLKPSDLTKEKDVELLLAEQVSVFILIDRRMLKVCATTVITNIAEKPCVSCAHTLTKRLTAEVDALPATKFGKTQDRCL